MTHATDERRQIALLPDERLPALVDRSIALLRTHEPREPEAYYGAFSGGKDSCVIKELARLAGVRAVWHYHNTTIDPPELVRFIREHHADVEWTRPKHGNFFVRMVDAGRFPTRRQRWCCEEYKEGASPPGSQLILGVRAAESPRRAKRWQDVTFHTSTKAWAVAPILSWSDDDVWQFIRSRGVPYCSLYDEGFKRLGCIGCPMADAQRAAQFRRWPRYEASWKRAFRRIWERRSGTMTRDGRQWFGDRYFETWEELWAWYASSESVPTGESEEQCSLALDDWGGA